MCLMMSSAVKLGGGLRRSQDINKDGRLPLTETEARVSQKQTPPSHSEAEQRVLAGLSCQS